VYQLDFYREYVTTGTVEGVGDFKTGRQVILTVKYAVTSCYWLRRKRSYRAD
jgi:hypothetical protein